MQAGFRDEEDVLPVPVFGAELELLVAEGRRAGGPSKLDAVALLELLQKLLAAVPRTGTALVKAHQRQCETLLYDVLSHGVGPAVGTAHTEGLYS
jgi:hypothetical protein